MMPSKLLLSKHSRTLRLLATRIIRQSTIQTVHSSSTLFDKPKLGSVVERGNANFDSTLTEAGNVPVIVDFYADWCGPCRVIGPVLKRVVEKNGKTFLVKVNVDLADEVAEKYSISSLPTVAAFKKGEIIDKFIGSRPEGEVSKFVEKVVSTENA